MGTTRRGRALRLQPRRPSVGQLALTGAASIAPWLREQLYTPTGYKQVPPLVLNAAPETQEAFLAATTPVTV